MWFLSKPLGGNVRRFVFFLILIIFAVVTPAWSEVLRNTDIDYVLDLYKKVESFGFYKDSVGTEPIGTKTVNGVSTAYTEGIPNNPLEINTDYQNHTPQYYFIIRSNYSNHNYDFKLSVSTFNSTKGGNSIGYSLYIQDIDDTNYFDVASAEIKGETFKDENVVNLRKYIDVNSDTKPDEWVWGFYYSFDSNELAQVAEGDYIATVKMEVTVN